jgi:hypothetical protein
MRVRFCALAAGFSALVAGPSLALTVQSAPPSPDLAHRLAPTGKTFGPRPEESWAGGGRPAERASGFYSDGQSYTSSRSFGSATVTTTFQNGSPRDAWTDPRWTDERRETPAPLSLSPPRR